jgi:hypothetical protein
MAGRAVPIEECLATLLGFRERPIERGLVGARRRSEPASKSRRMTRLRIIGPLRPPV